MSFTVKTLTIVMAGAILPVKIVCVDMEKNKLASCRNQRRFTQEPKPLRTVVKRYLCIPCYSLQIAVKHNGFRWQTENMRNVGVRHCSGSARIQWVKTRASCAVSKNCDDMSEHCVENQRRIGIDYQTVYSSKGLQQVNGNIVWFIARFLN
jgi:hypothetical protein